MHARLGQRPGKPKVGLFSQAVQRSLLFLPFALLFIVSTRVQEGMSLVLWLGTLAQAMGCLLVLSTRQAGREPAWPAVIMLYVIALSWLMLGAAGANDWFLHLAQAALLVVPLVFFAGQCLRDSGAATMRQARQLAAQLAARKNWPADLLACRLLPEVKALRESLHFDATPALELLANTRAEVRIAALAALEFRQSWRPGQPQIVLRLAQRAVEPEVRTAAVNALANLDERAIIEPLAELMRDSSSLVRQTTMEALLWNTEQRWGWIRHAVRNALGDIVGQSDGPLRLTGSQMTADAQSDLLAWCAEKGIIALRAALTLGTYYGQILAAGTSPETAGQLRKRLIDSKTPPMLRLELARLLYQHRELDGDDLLKLLNPSMPAPVRLIGVDALLSAGSCPEAVSALHDLARLPNREIALSTAEVVQRRLGIDLGLPRNQPLPPVHSRTAAEVARRVLTWASQHEVIDSSAGAAATPRSDMQSGVRKSSRVDLGQR
jgi:hypothetical protein